jgi:hypothetical protein
VQSFKLKTDILGLGPRLAVLSESAGVHSNHLVLMKRKKNFINMQPSNTNDQPYPAKHPEKNCASLRAASASVWNH